MTIGEGEKLSEVSITPGQQMIASCSGALLTSIFATPMDVVKIRLQSQTKTIQKGSCFIYSNGLMDHICTVNCTICANGNGKGMATSSLNSVAKEWYARPARFTGTVDAFVKIARYEGVTSLWSGLPPTLVMAVPATIVYFTTYDQLKYMMGYQEFDPSTQYVPIWAGTTARVLTTTIISPLELIRTKMQSEQLSYRQVGVALRSSMEQGGVRSLMRGLGPSLLRDLPFSALYWYGYEYMKVLQLIQSGSTEPTFSQSFLSGAVSGTVAAVLTLPFDVVKTHRQIELGVSLTQGNPPSSSTWVIIGKLYAEKGVSALFAGMIPRILKVAPACAIMISSYEYGKSFFRHHNAEKARLQSDT
jgi:solute carrier family 25 protein 39/40